MDFFHSTLVPALMFDGSIIGFPGFQDSVTEFEVLKDEFKKYCGITYKYDVEDAENREIALYEAVYYKEAWQSKSADEFNEIACREYLRVASIILYMASFCSSVRLHHLSKSCFNSGVSSTISFSVKTVTL